MIRDRLKSAARKAAIKLLKMEFDTEDRDPNARGVTDPARFDPDKIPKIVDGAGDTPGPNHRTDIGRTWVSAQLAGGVPPFFLDIRPPNEVVGGMLPGAVLCSGQSARERQHLLPADREQRLVIYDQTGDQGSTELAAWLRENGWPLARRLQGGYAEWLEHAEPTQPAPVVAGAARQVGDAVKLRDGRAGVIHSVERDGAGFRYTVWLSAGQVLGPLDDTAF